MKGVANVSVSLTDWNTNLPVLPETLQSLHTLECSPQTPDCQHRLFQDFSSFFFAFSD